MSAKFLLGVMIRQGFYSDLPTCDTFAAAAELFIGYNMTKTLLFVDVVSDRSVGCDTVRWTRDDSKIRSFVGR